MKSDLFPTIFHDFLRNKPIPIIPRASTGSENRWNGPNRGFFRGTDDEKTFVSGRIKENCRKLGYMLKPEGVKENLKKITRKFNTTLFEI